MQTPPSKLRANSMLELKWAIYNHHGWTRKPGESMAARIKKLYTFSIDFERGGFVATEIRKGGTNV